MGFLRDMLGSASRVDADAYAQALTNADHNGETPQEYATRQQLAQRLPARVRWQIEDGK
jgi:hypothetical protein